MAEFRDNDLDRDTGGEERPSKSLRTAIRLVRDRQAERDDVVVELQATERVRIEELADELRTLVNEIPEGDERFEFAVSTGENPRLWVDMTSHVHMSADRRTYRFVKDTRLGRIVLGETHDMEKIADTIALYVAEKIQERERQIEGEWVSLREAQKAQEDAVVQQAPVKKKGGFWRGLFTFLFGVAVTLGVLLAAAYYLVPDAL